jgi:hypothetical protein
MPLRLDSSLIASATCDSERRIELGPLRCAKPATGGGLHSLQFCKALTGGS